MLKRITGLLLTLLLLLNGLGGSVKAAEDPREAEILGAFLEELSRLTAAYGGGEDSGEEPYATARLLVRSEKGLDRLGAVEVLRWGDWFVLQYACAAEAKTAAEAYQAAGLTVDIDHRIHASTAGETTDFYSWGFGEEYVNIQALQQRVLDKVGGDVSLLPQIIVGVVDSGLDSGNDIFKGRVAAGYDAMNYDHTAEEGSYHGTHVATTIAEGTLSNVKIMPIKVLGADGLGYYSTFAFGMHYAVKQGCRVVNLSIGDKCYFDESHDAFVEAVEAGHEKGVVFCVAAANFSDDADNYCPANVEGVITVAAHDVSRQLAYNSNFGDCVDITAPGVAILGAYRDGSMTAMTGTSMATPHVSAVCALILSYDETLTPEEVRAIICGNAAPSDIEGGGAGLLCCSGIFAEGETAPVTYESPTAVWYFESEVERDPWEGQGGWYAGSPYDVLILQGRTSMYSNGTGARLISPTFTAGESVSFVVSKADYEAEAGVITVSVSTNGGMNFDPPIASFPITAIPQVCRVDLSAYAGQEIRLGLKQQEHEAGATVVVDAVALSGGAMAPVNVTFLSNVEEEPLAVVSIPAGAALTGDSFPDLPEYKDRTFCGWDYDGTILYSDLTVTAWYTDPMTSGWDFEVDLSLSGWTTIDRDGDGNDWFQFQKSDTVTPPQGAGMMCSYSYVEESLNPDNWLVSPVFIAGEQVRFSMMALNGLLTNETVGFYISTDGGETWSEELGYFTAAEETQSFTVDTAAYKGRNIQIAFRHYDDPRQYAVGIDAVEILGDRTAPVNYPLLIGSGAAAVAALAAVIALIVRSAKRRERQEVSGEDRE